MLPCAEREVKAKMANCALCGREITNEEAPVLTMGGYGVPRYLCDNCAEQIDVATTSTNIDHISAAIKALGAKLSATDHDNATMSAMTEILDGAVKRGSEIKEGTYDFSLDENETEELLDIPEEMLESEEDKILDEQDEKKNEKMNSVFNWITIILFAALGAFAIYRILDLFLL